MVVIAAAIAFGAYEHGGSSAPAARDSEALVELAAAANSLRSGVGPARGGSLSCSSAGVETESCGDASLPASSTAHYTWSNLSSLLTTGPSARTTVMTWDASDGYVLLFGGSNPLLSIALTDTWTYLNGTWTNITAHVTGAPAPVFDASMAYDSSAAKVVLFGGITIGGVYRAYTYTYHAQGWANLTGVSTAPSPRAFAALSMDTAGTDMVLFGGRVNANAWVADTWIFTGTWTNLTSAQRIVLPSIFAPVAADDPAGGNALLFGGALWAGGTHAVTYTFALDNWVNVTASSGTQPPAPYFGSAVYLPALSGAVLFETWYRSAANFPVSQSGTWLFVGGVWTNLTAVVAPSGLWSDWAPAVAVTPYDQSVLAFGGSGPVLASPYLWVFSPLTAVTARESTPTTDVGLNVSFTGAITSGLLPTTGAWSFGDGSNASGLIATHAYGTSGVYQANFTGISLAGVSATQSVLLLVNPALSASFSAVPTTPRAESPVGFVPTISGGSAPYTYAWSMGDGATSTATAPTHVYAAIGTYHIVLNVTDAAGEKVQATGDLVVASNTSTTPTSSNSTSSIPLEYPIAIGVLGAVVVLLAVLVVRLMRQRPPAPKAPAG